ncbi:MAG: hypothetical protein Kow0099_32690 [Candidatus Abyssubacteria bacterium]
MFRSRLTSMRYGRAHNFRVSVNPHVSVMLRRGNLARIAGGCCVVALVLFSAIDIWASDTRDLIIVLDVSTSMLEHFDRAKAEAKKFVSSAQLGDRVTIITFGKTSHLLERKRIRSSYDIARILSALDNLSPTEFSTNLPAGMERGIEELQRFYEEHPEGQRVMMWLSDDKHNPPKDIPNLITFNSIKQREAGRLPDHNWFVFESPIESERKSDMKWFVDWASRVSMKLKVTLLQSDLGTLYAPDPASVFRVRFEPDTQAMWGSTFSVVAEVSADDGYAASVPIAPPLIVCSDAPWEETFRVTLPERPGEYALRVSFVLPSDKLLEISPSQTVLTGWVQESMKTVDRVAETSRDNVQPSDRAMRDRPRTQTALASEMRAELEDAGLIPSRTELVFGPIVAGGQYRESTSLYPTRNIPLDSIQMKTNFELPEGIEIEPAFRITEGTLVADLLVDASETSIQNDAWDVRGMLSFYSTEENVSIAPSQIAVRLYSKSETSRWGRRELVELGTYDGFGRFWHIAKTYMMKVAMTIPVILAVWFVIYKVKKHRFGSTDLLGVLETVKAPGSHKLKTFNLRRLGRIKSRSSLTIGSGHTADIVLNDTSVDHIHAKITTAQTAAGPVVFVQPISYNEISVNGVVYNRKKEIANGDKVGIGQFVLCYKCPDMFRETLLEFADGTRLRGSLFTWDIDAAAFEFLPKGAPSSEARMLVEFKELKTVSFIRKPSRFSMPFSRNRKPTGRPVEVLFEDGELLEGYMVGEASEWSKRFYMIPKANGEVALILVERSSVQSLTTAMAYDYS